MDWSKVRNFKESEFACKCGCGYNVINPQLVMALDMARKEAKVPFTISSGCRCKNHNATVGGVDDSAHVRGHAADIAVRGSAHRMAVLRALLRYFDRIGVDKNFIHVDNDPDKPASVLWVY